MNMDVNSVNKIVFWGPQSSGKTWLFNAFLKKIEILNKKLKSLGHSIVTQEQRDGRWVDVGHVEDLIEKPTPGMIESYYRILRRRDGDSILSQVNNQCHEILVVDNAGGFFEKRKRNDLTVNEIERAKEKVKKAHYLVLALNSGQQENANDGAIVENLKELSGYVEDGSAGKYIAACLTKVDSLGQELIVELYNRDKSELRSLLIRSFGVRYVDQIYDALDALKCDDKNRVELFATSATGYYLDSENVKRQNISSDHKVLADSAKWHPEEVETPFFWLFDRIECERLQYLSEKGNLYQTIMGKKTIIETRQATDIYVSYDQLVRLAKSR
jgi:hypothetical protein